MQAQTDMQLMAADTSRTADDTADYAAEFRSLSVAEADFSPTFQLAKIRHAKTDLSL
jgi:hypothetical protein